MIWNLAVEKPLLKVTTNLGSEMIDAMYIK